MIFKTQKKGKSICYAPHIFCVFGVMICSLVGWSASRCCIRSLWIRWNLWHNLHVLAKLAYHHHQENNDNTNNSNKSQTHHHSPSCHYKVKTRHRQSAFYKLALAIHHLLPHNANRSIQLHTQHSKYHPSSSDVLGSIEVFFVSIFCSSSSSSALRFALQVLVC